MADQVVEVPGGTNNNNYANVPRIVAIAEQMNVDAVWAGWGHASENPNLPTTLKSKGIVFIGPPAAPMHALGDKIGSTIIAQTAKVPTISWNGDGLILPKKDDMNIPKEIYDKGCIHSDKEALNAAERIGYPIMIKASEGGGGKGIRLVSSSDQMEAAYRQVSDEVPGSPIFVMKVSENSKHLEVQLLGDLYDNVISLNGRDCSVQRRHQKIIEEGPPLAPTKSTWNEMASSAVRLAKLVHYQNAGTVEFLFTQDDKFYFLELNPRLQVEHPVTEMLTGVNLPAAQLMVAMGLPLWAIPDVRKLYNLLPFPVSPIDFDKTEQLPPKGHVIACRITAENPDAGFQPTSGSLREINFRTVQDVWGYFSIDSSGKIHEYADSQFGHLFAFGVTRGKARRNMINALKNLTIRGDIRTTTEYLITLLESQEFKEYSVTTSWLDNRLHANVTSKGKLDNLLVAMIGSVCKAHKKIKDLTLEFVNFLKRGQVPADELVNINQEIELIYDNIKYKFNVHQSGEIDFTIECNGTFATIQCRDLTDGGYLCMFNGKSHVAYLQESATGTRMILDSVTCLFTSEYDPTQLKSTNAGKLARYLVESGSHVDKNKPYAEIEVMKMYMPLLAPEDGEITFTLAEGSVISPGDVIGKMKLDDPTKVKHSELFDGQLPKSDNSESLKLRPQELLTKVVGRMTMILNGYYVSREKLNDIFNQFTDTIKNYYIPFMEYMDIMSTIETRLPEKLVKSLKRFAATYDDKTLFIQADDGKMEINPNAQKTIRTNSLTQGEFPVREIGNIIREFIENVKQESVKTEVQGHCKPLFDLVEKYKHGIGGLEIEYYKKMFKQYIDTEKVYMNNSRVDEIVTVLKNKYNDPEKGPLQIYQKMLSHASLIARNDLIVKLLKSFPSISHIDKSLNEFKDTLDEMAGLNDNKYAQVAMEARLLLMHLQMPNDKELKEKIKNIFSEIIKSNSSEVKDKKINEVLNQPEDINNALLEIMNYRDKKFVLLAMETYLRRIYSSYTIHHIEVVNLSISSLKFTFSSKEPNFPLNGSTSDWNLSKLVQDDIDSLQIAASPVPDSRQNVLREGILCYVSDITDLEDSLPEILNLLQQPDTPSPLPSVSPKKDPIHVVHAIMQYADEIDESELLPHEWTQYLESHRNELMNARIRRITVTIPCDSKLLSFPRIYTFRSSNNYGEDIIVRHIEPPMAYHLELTRMSNFNIKLIPTPNRNIHMYFAEPKRVEGSQKLKAKFFVRVVMRSLVQQTIEDIVSDKPHGNSELERCFVETLNALELGITELMLQPKFNKLYEIEGNHIFLNVLPDVLSSVETLESVISLFYTRYASIIKRVKVSVIELKVSAKFQPDLEPLTTLLVATNPTGLAVKVDPYVEVKDFTNNNTIYTTMSSNTHGLSELDGMNVFTPYPVKEPFENQRAAAVSSSGTVYCYDFLELINRALLLLWKKHANDHPDENIRIPTTFTKARELVLDDSPAGSEGLKEVQGSVGDNKIGMVAWRITLYTPVFPSTMGGREIILIANDITKRAGSFGTKEDRLFSLATQLARQKKIPRIYFAANSGARIGLAEEVKSLFNVGWSDEENPMKGFDYLYLTPENYEKLQSTNSVNCEKHIMKNGEVRYVLNAIIGKDSDLGVENLRGSGTIAGDTSKAYEDIFTLTYVTGRSVGIGAYLVRLGQRTIQKDKAAPIILTGYSALNKLMGKKVYTSNTQLGGPNIMYNNGVSHLVVNDDLEGVQKVIEWLEFIPRSRGESLPLYPPPPTLDVIERDIEYVCPSTPADPRDMLRGVQIGDKFLRGFFDRGSFVESLSAWAKTVICGRARLGGIPCGIIATENRTVECVIPADPAIPQSQEQTILQAGGVWYPDSAYKTATAINDFNSEDLPLIIFANWRGFSGGAHDMFEQVLKFGSQIVDALVHYKAPIIVYLPPHSELRGGAWVVLDSTINIDMIEMYADKDSRGGVLEPAGTIEIKFREKEILNTCHRLDTTLQNIDKQLNDPNIKPEDKITLTDAKKRREELLFTTYRHIAERFADLHDAPGRMHAKGVIRDVVDWKNARNYFYRRLKRRLVESDRRKLIIKASPNISFSEAGKLLKSWFDLDQNRNKTVYDSDWEDDNYITRWLVDQKENIQRRIANLKRQYIRETVIKLGKEDGTGALQGILSLINELPKEEGDALLLSMKRQVLSNPRGSLS